MNEPGFVLRNIGDLDAVRSGDIQVKPEPKRRTFTIRRPGEILAMEFDGSDRILGDYVMGKGQPTTILGMGGLGKSRLLLQMAVSTILGRKFIGFETRGEGLKWLILQTENTNRRLQSDLLALQQWAGAGWSKVDSQLLIHTLEEDDDGFVTLSHPENQGIIIGLLDDHRPDVLAFDPLGDFGIGNLNDDTDMRATCQAMSRIGKTGNANRAIIAMHHARTGKAGAAGATGYDRGSFGRNSKALQAWTRAQINIAPGSPDDNDVLVISCGKCSNGREFPAFAVHLNSETMIYEVDTHFDIEAWEAEVGGGSGKKKTLCPEAVPAHCSANPTKQNLVRILMDETGCGKTKAYDVVEAAEKMKLIKRHPIHKTYVAL